MTPSLKGQHEIVTMLPVLYCDLGLKCLPQVHVRKLDLYELYCKDSVLGAVPYAKAWSEAWHDWVMEKLLGPSGGLQISLMSS